MYTFEHIDSKPIPGGKVWCPDLSSLGKHYLVWAKNSPKTKRHYTACNSMNPAIMEELVALAEAALHGEDFKLKQKLFEESETHKTYVTSKNYRTKTGLSSLLWETEVSSANNIEG